MKKMKKVLIVASGFIGVIVIIASIFWMGLSSNMTKIKNVPIYNLDFTLYNDGVFEGSYYYEEQIGATVLVEVSNGEVIDITILEHLAGKGTIAEVITEDIIRNQTLIVDDISGATTSSHVLKLAIQDALEEE